ncbi:hypothetical protein DK847_15785 [Aestuariivirga litoralis]|uniref:Cytochrome c domain-containing protein n=1 Tax=Aestuariivirga litoralis TaxID=2650924 RepID=A0A2W2C7C7_9HYPH|nr:cytochrome c [Aestuariivirga litoralis]PZF76093.1 hypothetical protein DK847_15785 [Aestuariivirga litoralis]
MKISIAASLVSFFLLVAPALAAKVPSPAELQARQLAEPVTVTVLEPHFGSARRGYLAYPARLVLEQVLGEGWNQPGTSIRFKALDGYASVIPAAVLAGPDAYLAFAMADGGPFEVDNALQNETDIPLGPWYLVWDNIRNPSLRDNGAVIWPYQVSEVEIAEAGEEQLFPGGLDGRYAAGGKLVQVNCITCHKVNGYGGDKLAIDLPVVVRQKPPQDFLRWVLSPRSVKPDTTMPGLPPEWPEARRLEAAQAIYDYLVNVPLVPPAE